MMLLIVVGPTDCLLEGELLKLGGPFLQMWQRKHAKLYPNRLEFYSKTRDGQVTKGKEGKGVEVRDVFMLSSLVQLLSSFCFIVNIVVIVIIIFLFLNQ